MCVLVDLSQRDIRIMRDGGEEILPFVDLERNFPGKIYKLFERFPEVQDVFVINGPGSFTTLRIGCLCLNLIQLWRKKTLRFHPTNKMDLYSYAFQQGLLPQHGLMWIGQSKNVWEVNLESGGKEKVRIDEVSSQTVDKKRIWLDTSVVSMEGYSTLSSGEENNLVTISCSESIYIHYHEKNLDIKPFLLQKTLTFLEPEYMVEL